MSTILKAMAFNFKTLFFILFGFLFLSFNSALGQEKYQLAYEKQGDIEMERGNYEMAIENYTIARKFFKTPSRLYYKCALACQKAKNYDKAEYWYEKLISEFENEDLNKDYPYLYLNLARVSIQNSNSIYAKEILEKLIQSNPPMNIYKEAKRELKRIEWIIENNYLLEGIIIENLGKNINNHSSQTSSFLINDSILFYTSLIYKENKDRNGKVYYSDISNKIHYSLVDSNYHSKGLIFEEKRINKRNKNISNLCFDTLNNRAYFTICNELSDDAICKIYYSEFKQGKWSKAKRLNKLINIKGYNNTHPFFVRKGNENILYFSSNRPGGVGGYDIWFVNIDSLDMEPINLGVGINSLGNEITPFYDSKNEELYFSSDYHFGYGGYDIFRAKGWLQRWQNVENLKLPINSPANETHPFISDKDNKGYFTSNREGSFSDENKTCCYDIYRFYKIETQSKPIIEIIKKSNPFIPALDLPLSLYFHNDQPNPNSISKTTNIDYKECFNEYISLSNHYKAQYSKNLIDSLETNAIDSIEYFFENKVRKSMDKLDLMLAFVLEKLNKGEKINISIRGYSSSLHNDLYNYSLSERRINSLVNYLRKWNKGVLIKYMDTMAEDSIPFLNIKTLGLGKIESLSPNPNNREEKINSIYRLDAMNERRIEIKLIEFRTNN